MKTLIKAVLLASAGIGAVAIVPTIAAAQAVSNVAVADLEDAVAKSNAYVLAVNQIKITHKATIEKVDARTAVLNNELQVLAKAFETARAAPNPNQAALQQQAQSIQGKQEAAQRELQTLALPYARAEAFAKQQITAKLETALKNVMAAKRLSMVIKPDVLWLPAAASSDVTADVVAQLNTLVPSVSITPPAAGAAPAAAPGTPPKPQPSGR
jgi:Skp family chaperone for outer membrane proteins